MLRKQPQYRNNVNDKYAKQMRWWAAIREGSGNLLEGPCKSDHKVPPSDHRQFLEISVANGRA